MKLYYSPGACSLATHIALIEAGIPYQLISVGRDKFTGDGRNFIKINPKGYVPALELDDGNVMTENLAILMFIAHSSGMLLASQGMARWRVLEATVFMTTEIHGNFKPFFHAGATEAEQDKAKSLLIKNFGLLSEQLGEKEYLVGEEPTIADIYLFVMLSWLDHLKLEGAEPFQGYLQRMKSLPSVQLALKEEGLI
ncbi:glutathione S-transferase domain-containing protein [Pseudomonas fluorescens]|uniref:Glutathione S-transferase domain-containing protein n=1 Tax=Pseudomonas fluorescens TaxID=294 RepID=A0A379IFI1_PSEFL|nr:glutathione S-transferase C-terminal domain-containing protein [Pseudomonas fluorescens]AIG01290.1 glutathione S-transferase [Pseudomonas fluorescens]SUD31043.1 glutathione S-transferase domain-containing protein [Pseudomonas fluorescens]